MIRNGVLGRLRPPRDAAQAEADVAALRVGLVGLAGCLRRSAELRGRRGRWVAGERWRLAITSDWAEVESYRAYDEEPEHNRLRRVGFGPLCPDIARVQFEVDRSTADSPSAVRGLLARPGASWLDRPPTANIAPASMNRARATVPSSCRRA